MPPPWKSKSTGYSLVESVQLCALRNTIVKDNDYALRRIFRWYSRTFHTPLHQVVDLPLEDVFLAWYEEEFAQLSPDELKEEIARVLKTPEEEREERLRKDCEAAEDFEIERAEVAKQEQQKMKNVVSKSDALLNIPLSVQDLPMSNTETDVNVRFLEDTEIKRLLETDEAVPS